MTRRGNIEYHFAFCRHEAEFADSVAQSISGCDVIAMEATATARTKVFLTNAANRLLSPDETLTAQEIAYLNKNPFLIGVLSHFEDSGKQFVALDASDAEEEVWASLAADDQAEDEFYEALEQNRPNEELRDLMASLISADARSHLLREELVIRQLESIGAPSEETLSVGVIMGSAHTPVQHHLSRTGHVVERSFHVGNLAGPPEIHTFPYRLERSRAERLDTANKSDEAMLNRALLEDMYTSFSVMSNCWLYEKGPNALTRARIISKMTDGEISAALNAIDKLKQTDDHSAESQAAVRSSIYDYLRENALRYDIALATWYKKIAA